VGAIEWPGAPSDRLRGPLPTSKTCSFLIIFFIAACGLPFSQQTPSEKKPGNDQPWNFAVSGDSRNCGDVVVPSIAAGAQKNHAAFYWHLGDLRAIYGVDEDYQHAPEHRSKLVERDAYLKDAWDDFIQNQLAPFGSMPVFVGIGNHETTPPKTREQFAEKFAKWLDSSTLKKQRLADDPQDTGPKTYFHWIQGGVDFIYLDNSTLDQFSPQQVTWLEGVVKRASSNSEVRALVLGMHAALPDSLAHGHSMNDWLVGAESGRLVYTDLVNFNKQTHKNVYLLASHSHFYMSGIFNSDYWKAHGGELPGWIVGTAGAMRYALPPDAPRAKEARTKIYGFLVGTVHTDGSIDFKFEEIKRPDTPAAVSQRYTPEFVDFCFDKNTNFSETAEPAHQ
jgi:Calcineurin-like phosphoesterase